MPTLSTIEGIGPKYAKQLAKCGCRTTGAILKMGAKPAGRKKLAADSGCTTKQILEWVNRADLMRIKGVGEEYSDLLEVTGVDTVKELRNRNAENLHKAMHDINAKKKCVRRPPSLGETKRWIAHAKRLKPGVSY